MIQNPSRISSLLVPPWDGVWTEVCLGQVWVLEQPEELEHHLLIKKKKPTSLNSV